MNTFETDASDKLDRIALDIMKFENVTDYVVALKKAMEKNPRLAHQYNFGTTGVKRYDLSPLEGAMAELQADAEKTKRLAGDVITHHATARAEKIGPISQLSPETLMAATKQLIEEYPSLGRAYESGYISSTDWWLLGTLIPSTAGMIEKEKGVICGVAIYQERGTELKKFDDAGREYRRYTLNVR